MAKRQPAPVINLSTLPLFLTIDDMAALYRVSTKTIKRRIWAGTIRPLPARKYPYLWRRDDVIRDYNAPSTKLPRRQHGFAAAKAHRQAADYAATK
jgi:Helix-turn-helix domain